MNWCIRQDSHLQTLRSKRRMIIISSRMRNEADGETRTLVGQGPAVYKTAAVAAEPHRQNGGLPRNRTEFSPVKSRDFTVKVCNPNANAKVELNHRSQVCEALTGTGVRVAKKNPKRTESGTRPLLRPCGVSAGRPDSLGKVDGHESNALSISVWKTDVCLSTPMPEEMESRAGIAPASVALQSTA